MRERKRACDLSSRASRNASPRTLKTETERKIAAAGTKTHQGAN